MLATLVLLAGACGDSKSSSDGGGTVDAGKCPVGAFAKAPGVTTIKVWHSYAGKLKQALEKIAADYNAGHPKVKVEVELQGNSYGELLRKFQAGIPTKQLPAITIGEDIERASTPIPRRRSRSRTSSPRSGAPTPSRASSTRPR